MFPSLYRLVVYYSSFSLLLSCQPSLSDSLARSKTRTNERVCVLLNSSLGFCPIITFSSTIYASVVPDHTVTETYRRVDEGIVRKMCFVFYGTIIFASAFAVVRFGYCANCYHFKNPETMDQNISVPYTSKLGSPLVGGQSLSFKGNVNADANRFEVNLLAGGTEIGEAQAYLHCSCRFDEGKIVLNSYTDGAWGKEEREKMPFKKGEKFCMRIRVLEDGYEIRCNGEVVHTFKHRKPYTEVEYFQVKGDCSLSNVHWGGKFYEIPWETGFANGNLQSGQQIHISGAPKGDRFNVDLIARNGDILFHFNPRLNENKIVRNSCKNKVWGNEEREGPQPFKKNHSFQLTIVNEPFSIQILVDGDQIGTFAHRTENPAQDYIGMRVAGEVEIFGIEFSGV